MQKSNITHQIDCSKKDIMNILSNCIVEVDTVIEKLKRPYSPALNELISVLLEYQNEDIFICNEAKAIREYFQSKGYTQKQIKELVDCLIDE